MNTSNGLINTASEQTHQKFSKNQLRALNKPLTDNQFIRELDKLKIPRSLKKELFQSRIAGVRS